MVGGIRDRLEVLQEDEGIDGTRVKQEPEDISVVLPALAPDLVVAPKLVRLVYTPNELFVLENAWWTSDCFDCAITILPLHSSVPLWLAVRGHRVH